MPNEGTQDSIIRFDCPFCGGHIRAPQTYAGKKGKCPNCKNIVLIPQPTSPPQQQEDEPIRLKRDLDLPAEPARPVQTPPQQWHRTGPEPVADAAAGTDKFAPGPEQKPATLVDMFAFPFSLSGVIHFLLFWFGPPLLGLAERIFAYACCYGQLLVIGLYIALIGYFYFYLSNCVIAAAKDERAAPDVSLDDAPSFADLLRRVLLIFGCTLICFGPVILYVFYFYIWPFIGRERWLETALTNWRTDPWYWTLYGVGVFFFPMFLLAAALFDSITAFNPFLIISSIASTLLPYCVLVLLFCVIGLLMNFVGQLQPGGLPLLAWGIDVYLIFIAAYILGWFFRRYENRLHWEVKL